MSHFEENGHSSIVEASKAFDFVHAEEWRQHFRVRSTTDDPWLGSLLALLVGLKWNGSAVELEAYLPEDNARIDINGLLNILVRLGYTPIETTWERLRGSKDFPALLLQDGQPPRVALERIDTSKSALALLLGLHDKSYEAPSAGTQVFAFHPNDPNAPLSPNWFADTVHRFQTPLFAAIGLSTLANLLMLVIPFFTMTVYDTAIPSRSFSVAVHLGIGAIIAIAMLSVMRWMRNRILTFVGGRLGFLIATATFERILSLPLAASSRSTKSSLASRFRDLETIRDFFSGPLAAALLDLPFVVLFLIALGWIAGWIVVVPVLAILAYAMVTPIFAYYMRRASMRSAGAGSMREEMQLEGISSIRALVYTGGAKAWLQEFETATSKAARASRIHAILHSGLHATAHTLSQLTVLATLAFGIVLVVNQQMTAGGLIAAMMFIGRITAPVQTLAVSITALTHMKSSIAQIDRLMEMRGEYSNAPPPVRFDPPTECSLTFDKVSFRYLADQDLAANGLSFQIPAGAVVAVLGPNGAGKSTLLKLAAGLLVPQSGRVLVGGRNLRQFRPLAFRSWAGYSSDRPAFFRRTLAANLRICRPMATDEELMEALEASGAFSVIERSPDVLQMEVVHSSGLPVSDAVADVIGLARAMLDKSPLILLDQPRAADDSRYDEEFRRFLDRCRGKATVIFVTHNLTRAQMADQLVVLNKGALTYSGPTKQPTSVERVSP